MAGTATRARPALNVLTRLAAAGLLAGLVACGPDTAPTANAGARRAVPVETAPVTTATLTERLRAVGTLLADESVMLRAEIPGRVARIHADEGQAVRAGDLLVTLDDAEHRAQVAQTEATVALNRLNFERARNLSRTRMVSAQDYDTAQARLKESEALLDRHRALLDKTALRAPFAGVLGLRRVSPGAYIQPGQDLVNLEALDPLKADFRLPERYGAQLGAGLAVRIGVDAAPGQTFAGTVYALDARLDPESRAWTLRARVPNPDGKLRPGMFARVEMDLRAVTDALVVPEQAIVPLGDQAFVFRVADGTARRVPVRTGLREVGRVQITEGLAAGDVVVIAGQMKLRDGVPVQALAPAGDAPAPGAPQVPGTPAPPGTPGAAPATDARPPAPETPAPAAPAPSSGTPTAPASTAPASTARAPA